MDVRHLQYFLETAKRRSFTKAAEALHVTQPTISKMIRTLEEELGVDLFDRSSRQIVLTDAGEAVLAQAQQIVRSVEQLSVQLGDVVSMRKGQIRIGLPPMIGAPFFPELIAAFHRLYPGIGIRLIEEGGRTVEQEVENGSLDLGVAVLPVDPLKFDQFSFVKEELRLVVHKEHRLANRKSVRLAELSREPFLMFQEDFTLYERIPQACIQAGFKPDIIYESSQWDFLSAMAGAGLGVALLPETICRRLDPAKVVDITLVSPSIQWHLAMIWRKDGYLSFAAREWLRFSREWLFKPEC
ncbi:LysR family transcriptional regulator [Paenibacillus lutrae]|uniref:LysR family transcriptional regulator n=1 Tax=Paenibacillus lutrae TaxID=2078573 RepID=A0A7X3FIR7_9BACL|nr:LysR family transcriptional regulator [Paenibacillus lutrae]MVP00541.1 LysR family transcriptional regulator [Paenibacillus lutrae]